VDDRGFSRPMTIAAYLDRELLLTLNSLAADGASFFWWGLGGNTLIREFIIVFPLVALWFADDSKERRSRMLAGFLGVCLATLLSIWFQFHLNIHIRPLLDTALPLVVVKPEWATFFGDRANSFPSDTATLFYGLAMVVFLENRWVGLFCLFWATAVIAVPRIAFGWHYPSDIIGSAILGPGSVILFERISYLRISIERMLKLFDKGMYLIHALLFVFLAEAANLFASLQTIAKYLVK
jgi:membrane-associated phospholipid phosphatase